MTWTLSDGSTTASLTIGSETTLATDTNNGTFVLEVDVSNLTNGDLLEMRLYTITLSTGVLTQAWKGSYQGGLITNNHKISPPVASDQSIKTTLLQRGGTVTISSNTITGTVSDGLLFTGETSGAVGIIHTFGGAGLSSAAVTVNSVYISMSSSSTSNVLSSGEVVKVSSAVGSTAVSSANGTFTMNGAPTGRTFDWKMLRI